MASAEVIATVKASLTLCVLLLIAGCAAGTNVGRPASGALVPGKTTYQDVVAKYGTPWAKGSNVVNEHSIDTIAYAYASLVDEAHVPSIKPARGLNLWFENDVLIGYEFRSSFKSDHTDFDESRMSKIEKGKTDKQGIIEIFGQPTGEYIYPMMKDKEVTGLVYSYVQVDPGLFKTQTFQKKLIIAVDKTGVVREVDFAKGKVE